MLDPPSVCLLDLLPQPPWTVLADWVGRGPTVYVNDTVSAIMAGRGDAEQDPRADPPTTRGQCHRALTIVGYRTRPSSTDPVLRVDARFDEMRTSRIADL